MRKMLIFAASNLKFGYPGRIPRGQDYIDTTQIKKSPWEALLLSEIAFHEHLDIIVALNEAT